MAGNLVKSVMLKIVGDDGDAEAKLDKISAKAKELAAQHPDLKVKVDSAAASAKLAVLRKELKDTANAAGGDSTSLKSRLMGLTGAVASVTGVGDAMTVASGDASMFQKVMAGASLATGLLEPALAGGIVAVAGLGSGVAAAGVGLGVFGLVAKSAFSQASTAVKSFETAQNTTGKASATAMAQYKAEMAALPPAQQALAKSIISVQGTWQNFISSSTAGVSQVLVPAMKLIPTALGFASQFLGPVEAALQDVIIDVKQAMSSPFWKSTISEWAVTSGPMIEDIAVAIGHVIHGVAGILTTFMPMSTSLGSGLDSITAKFAKWGETLGSHSGFQSLMSMAKTEAPIAMQVLKNLATVILNVGKAMTGMDGVGNSKTLLQVLQPLSGILANLSKNQDLDRIALYLLAGADAGKKLKSAVSGISGGLKGLDKGVSLLGKFGGAAEDAGRGAKIASAATKVWTGIQAAFDVVMDANPIVLITIAIIAVVAAIVLAYTHFKTFRDIVNDVGRAIKTGFIDALHAVETAAKAVASFVASAWNGIKTTTQSIWNGVKQVVTAAVNGVESVVKSVFSAISSAISAAWNAVKTATSAVWNWIKGVISTDVNDVKAVLNWFSNLGTLFTGWWDKGVNAVESVAGKMLSFVRGIPGKILSALGNLGSLLFNAGKNVIQGLINGITSMAGSVGHAIGGIVSDIRSFLPFSPAKKGPLSGSGSPDLAGRKIGQMLAAGIDSSTSAVTASAHKMAGAATVSAAAAGAGAASAMAGQRLTLSIQGSDQNLTNALLLALRKQVRVSFGGNVQAALGH